MSSTAKSGTKTKKIFTKGWRAIRGAGPQRLFLTVMLLGFAVILAALSWKLPFTDNAERSIYDSRSYILAEKVEVDERILKIVYTDQTLIKLRKRSPLDRKMLSDTLRNIDAMGAKAIGIDILIDQPQDEDAELLDTLRAMQTPTLVAYAEQATNAQDIIYEQEEYLNDFFAQLEGTNTQPASIRLSAGQDNSEGITRVWPTIEEGLPPLIGRMMLAEAGEDISAFEGYEGSVRYRLPALADVPIYTSLDIDLFADPEMAANFASLVEGRYVLVGGDISDYDRVQTTFSVYANNASEAGGMSRLPPGMDVHAATIAQMLDGAALKTIPTWAIWLFAISVVLIAALTSLLELKSWLLVPLILVQLAAFIGLPVLLLMQGFDTYQFPAVGPILGWVLAFTAVTGAARAATATERSFAQNALGKYLPREMAAEIIANPELLALHGEKKEIYVLFSDLEGFTKMSHVLEPEMVAKLLNRYLEMLSQVVLDHGGVIDKFVGDAVVAFWGAPIAKDDDALRAAKAGYAIWQAGEAFREEVAAMEGDLPPIGKTRVGLHFGEAVVGNFGGDTRIQYTALGDSMNTAARLEAASKALQSSVMASKEFSDRSGLDWWRPMGRIVLRGRAKPVDIFEPAPNFPKADSEKLAQALDQIKTDPVKAIASIQSVIDNHPHDIALVNLRERCGNLNRENAHVLG